MAFTENATNFISTMEMETSSGTDGPSVVALAEEFLEYKISIYILTYMTLPVAVWGWMGNFLSFR